jgi:hypothetical protein
MSLATAGGKTRSTTPSPRSSTYDNNQNAGLNTSVQNCYNLRSERTISELDVSRQLAFPFVAELPFEPGRKWMSSARGIGWRLVEGWPRVLQVSAKLLF